jgi:hypothetical protein
MFVKSESEIALNGKMYLHYSHHVKDRAMKWLGVVLGIIVFVFATVYVLLFTPFGNGIVAPIVEAMINESVPLKATLEKFELDSSSFAITLQLSENNRIEAVGDYSLFDQSLNAAYRARLNNLTELRELTQRPFYGRLHTDGKITGTLNKLNITGNSDLAKSDTQYTVILTEFNPSAIQARIIDAELDKMLQIIGEKPYAAANISLEANLKSIDPKAMDGNVTLTIMQGSINTALMQHDFDLKLPETTFVLKTDTRLAGNQIAYTAKLESNLARFSSKGKVTPDPLETDLSYTVNIKELALFKPITNSPLRGPFATKGTIGGDQKQMRILGDSNIAGSKTTYDVVLKAFKPQRVLAKIENAKLAKLLYMADEPAYADGDLNVDLTLTDLDPENLKGHANVKLANGKFNSKVLKKAYDITLPKASFTYDLDAKLNGKQINYDTVFASNLAKIDSQGTIVPKAVGLDLGYRLAIKKLELLKPITNAPLQGPLNLNGTVKGDKRSLTVTGKSDLAKSKTFFEATLTEFTPKSIQAKIKDLELAGALYMVSQPHYADGVLNIDVDISDARAGKLNGSINLALSKGVVDGKVVSKAFAFKPMPRTTFSAVTTTKLYGDKIDTKADIISSLAKVTIKQARMDLGKELLASDYKAVVLDLDKLYFATERHLKGGITVTGDLKKGKHLDLNAHADTLGGALDANLHDDDLHADLKGIQTLDALKMLIYPQVFKASLEGTLDYNLKSQKGLFYAKLGSGQFAQNIMIDLIKQLGRVDLYKERFKGTLQSKINKELTYTNLDIRSNKSSITGKNIKLNSKTQQIKAKLDVVANNNPIGVKIKGNVNKPDVKVDVSKLIKKEAEKAIEKGVKKKLDKLFEKLF